MTTLEHKVLAPSSSHVQALLKGPRHILHNGTSIGLYARAKRSNGNKRRISLIPVQQNPFKFRRVDGMVVNVFYYIVLPIAKLSKGSYF